MTGRQGKIPNCSLYGVKSPENQIQTRDGPDRIEPFHSIQEEID